MKDSDIQHLVFLEFLDEAELFLQAYRERISASPRAFRIVTFHPSVTALFRKNRIPVVESFQFVPTESHRKLLSQTEACAQEIRSSCRLTDSQGVDGVYVENLLHPFFQDYSLWLYQIEAVAAAVERFQPREVVTAGSLTPLVTASVWVERKERFLAAIASQVAAKKGMKFRLLPLNISYNVQAHHRFIAVKDFVKGMLYQWMQDMIHLRGKWVAAPALGYNIDGVLQSLRKELPADYHVAVLDAPLKKGWKMFWDRTGGFFPSNADRRTELSADFKRQKNMFRDTLFRIIDKHCIIDGVSFAQWMKDKFTQAFEPEVINRTYYRSINLNRFFDRFRPEFIVAQYARDMSAVMSVIAKNKSIPALLIPHGSFTAIHDEYSRIDWRQNAFGMVTTPFEYLAVQTPLLNEFLAEIPAQSKLIVTGPLVFGRPTAHDPAAVENLRRKYAPNGEKILLHAGTPKFRRGQRLVNYETLDEYVDGIIKLIETVDKMEGVHLIVRYREIDGLSEAELQSLLPDSDKYSVASGGRFADFLALADLLISYSSTTVEEALQNNIPVLLFNPYRRYIHIKGVEISSENQPAKPSAVYNVNSPEGLEPALRWIVARHLTNSCDSEIFAPYRFKPSEIVSLREVILEKNFQPSVR